LYTVINVAALKELSTSGLEGRAIKLWLCLASNQDGYEFELSPAYIQKEWGFTDSTFKRAKSDLIDAHYLVPLPNGNYEFYEYPQQAKWDF